MDAKHVNSRGIFPRSSGYFYDSYLASEQLKVTIHLANNFQLSQELRDTLRALITIILRSCSFFGMAASTDAQSNCKVVLATGIAKSLLAEVTEGVKQLERPPLLVGFLSSADPAARVYAEWTGKTCNEK